MIYWCCLVCLCICKIGIISALFGDWIEHWWKSRAPYATITSSFKWLMHFFFHFFLIPYKDKNCSYHLIFLIIFFCNTVNVMLLKRIQYLISYWNEVINPILWVFYCLLWSEYKTIGVFYRSIRIVQTMVY